jgi:adenylate kinase family enzyme
MKSPSTPPAPKKLHPLDAARRAGVPLLAYETSDPQATIEGCTRALNSKLDETPVLRWDYVRGLVGLNDLGIQVAKKLAPQSPMQAAEPRACLQALAACAEPKVLCFWLNAHRYIRDVAVAQGLWNLRDAWKVHGSTLVLLCPAMQLPDELSHDIVVVTEPLPTPEEIGVIADRIAEAANIKLPDEDRPKIIDTLLGISAFAAEQSLAMSIVKKDGKWGVDRDALWERKRKMVEQTPGLSVWRETTTFDDLGGLENIKGFMTRILKSGKNPVRAVGFVDEIEKMFAGAAGDLSGVSQDQLRVFLTEMQDHNIPGIILIGPAGTGKSHIAKAAGAVADAEVLNIDTGAMTGSLVGESQAKIRKAFQTLHAVSQGKSLVVATCNKIAALPPELRRRFTLGTFFVDLPSDSERKAIWKIWLKKYGFAEDSKLPADEGWTGAEIKACCDVAYRTSMDLAEASTFVVPVCQSAADQIEALRKQANDRFISASKPGMYRYVERAAPALPTHRKIDLN